MITLNQTVKWTFITVNLDFFCENFIFTNIFKGHIFRIINSQLGHDSPTSVNERVILPFREGFAFTKLGIGKSLRK